LNERLQVRIDINFILFASKIEPILKIKKGYNIQAYVLLITHVIKVIILLWIFSPIYLFRNIKNV